MFQEFIGLAKEKSAHLLWLRPLISLLGIATLHIWAVVRGLGSDLSPVIDTQFVFFISFEFFCALALAGITLGFLNMLIFTASDVFGKFRYALSQQHRNPDPILKDHNSDFLIESALYAYFFLLFYLGNRAFLYLLPILVGLSLGYLGKKLRHKLVLRRASREQAGTSEETLRRFYESEERTLARVRISLITLMALSYSIHLGTVKARDMISTNAVVITTDRADIRGYLVGSTSSGLILYTEMDRSQFIPFSNVLVVKSERKNLEQTAAPEG